MHLTNPRAQMSFDRLAAIFEDQRGLPPAGLSALQDAFSSLVESGAKTLIEPGAGTGRIAIPALAAGFHVTAVDLSQPMLEAFRKCLSNLPELSDRCELICADAAALPFPDDGFDVGVLAQVLYLIPNWKRALDELVRVVKPGGRVVLVQERTMMSQELSRWDAAWREIAERVGHKPETQEPDDLAACAALAERTVGVVETQLASWEFGQAARERLAALDRLRPLYPTFSDDEWDASLSNFRAWYESSDLESSTWIGGSVTLTMVEGRVSDTQP